MTGRWATVAICAVLGAFAGALVTLIVGDSYEAEAIFVATSEDPGGDVEDEYGVTLARLATKPNVVGEALRAAGFEEIAEDPEEAINTRASGESPSFSVTATADDAEEAAEIANAAAIAVEEFTRERSSETGVRAAVIGPAGPPADESGLSVGLGILAGAAFGLSLGLLLALTRQPR